MKNKKRFRKIQLIQRQLSKFYYNRDASSRFYHSIDDLGITKSVSILSQAGFQDVDSTGIAQEIYINSLKDKLKKLDFDDRRCKRSNGWEHLYVYDVDDIKELTIEEVRIVWENRFSLCGTIDAAAEVLSILKYFDNDSNEPLYPYVNYLECEEITSLASHINKSQQCSSHDLSISVERNKLDFWKLILTRKFNSNDLVEPENSWSDIWIDTIEEIATINDEHLKYIWKNVLEHCDTIEVASALYARLRFIQGYDKVERDWLFYINSPSVLQFKYKLSSCTKLNQPNVASAFSINKKEKTFKYITTRINQTDFRTSLINRYGGKCCVTRCSELTSLEAAHIIPYMGGHSNLIDNGLLLRVDIHRLFDKNLITIDSNTHKLVISDKITDEYYRSLSGRDVYIPRSSDVFLKRHNDEYYAYN